MCKYIYVCVCAISVDTLKHAIFFFPFNVLKIFNPIRQPLLFSCHLLAIITLYDHTLIHANAFKGAMCNF